MQPHRGGKQNPALRSQPKDIRPHEWASKAGGRRQAGLWGGRVDLAVVKAKGRGKLRSMGWKLCVGMGELKSQLFFSPYSWDGGGEGQEAGKGLSWRREVGGRT